MLVYRLVMTFCYADMANMKWSRTVYVRASSLDKAMARAKETPEIVSSLAEGRFASCEAQVVEIVEGE